MIFSIDTSALIDLDRWYSYEVFASLWDDFLTNLANEGRLIASVEVREELAKRDDFLYRWTDERCPGMFIESDQQVLSNVTKVLAEYAAMLNPEKPSTHHADPFVIALAREAPRLLALTCPGHECAVVTHEGFNKLMRTACRDLGIETMRLIDMFKAEGCRL